jgi:hypothetical protein
VAVDLDERGSSRAARAAMLVEALSDPDRRDRILRRPETFLTRLGFCEVGVAIGDVVGATRRIVGPAVADRLLGEAGRYLLRHPDSLERLFRF